ncbi:hypothetical protein FKF73_02525 [Aeromonas hydrophila]|nr:hypothetical protein [Aeromonas hydrophila]
MASDQALRDLILASNPVGYFPLDTLANLGRDISTYANHGSQSGSFRQNIAQLAGMDVTMTQGVSAAFVTIPDRSEYKGRTFTMECVIVQAEDANLVIAERGGITRTGPCKASVRRCPCLPHPINSALARALAPYTGEQGRPGLPT